MENNATFWYSVEKTDLQIPARRLQEEPGSVLIHISNGDELPHRLFLARHFYLLLPRLVRLHLGKQRTDIIGSYVASNQMQSTTPTYNKLKMRTGSNCFINKNDS